MVVKRSQINKPPSLSPKFEGVFVGGEEVVEEEVHFAETMTSEVRDPLNMKRLNILNS